MIYGDGDFSQFGGVFRYETAEETALAPFSQFINVSGVFCFSSSFAAVKIRYLFIKYYSIKKFPK